MVKYLTVHDIIYSTGMRKIGKKKHKNQPSLATAQFPAYEAAENIAIAKGKKQIKKIIVFLSKHVVPSLLVVLIVGVAGFYIDTRVRLEKINIDELKQSIHDNMDIKIDALDTNINTKIDGLNTRIDGFNTRIDDINRRIERLEDNAMLPSTKIQLSVSDQFFSSSITSANTINLSSKSDSLLFSFANLNFDNDYEVGINSSTGEIVTFGDLKGQSFITKYFDKDNELELWVYGELNENGNWHGNCVLNGYDNSGELKYLLETEFNDGIRTTGEYKQIRYDKEDGQYIISKRIYNSNVGINGRIQGETYIYKGFMHIGEEKNDNAIRYADCIPADLIIYYNGEIFNGSFDDITGRAYSISYYEDRTVKTIYRGHFKNGEFNDARTRVSPDDRDLNAFWISWADKEKVYVYWNGSFKDGQQNCPMNIYLQQREVLNSVEIIEKKISEYSEFEGLYWRTNSM